MLIQNDNFFELIGLTTQLKYLMKNILERHGTVHPKLNKDDYKHIKDANEYGSFPSLYNINEMNGNTYIGRIESYLKFLKDTLKTSNADWFPIDKIPGLGFEFIII